jgi:agmatine deiminase
LAAIDWEYNAWGGKYPPYDLDNAVPARMAEVLGVPCFKAGMVLEGGSIDVNGRGLLLTTEACLLNANRNPGMSRAEIERRLGDMLGVHTVLWLGEGIEGDDTDGHIDDITRFVAEDTVVTVVEEDPKEQNFKALQDNLRRLRTMTAGPGRPLKVITLPMPAPVYCQGQRLPASYANFYIANRVVLMPGFRDRNDQVACATLQTLFPDRRVVVIDCTDLIWGLGAFHCLTQQVPA